MAEGLLNVDSCIVATTSEGEREAGQHGEDIGPGGP